MAKIRKLGNKVSRLTTQQIREKAQLFRIRLSELGIYESYQYIDIAKVLDTLNARGIISMEIVDDSKLSSEYAVTAPDQNKILIRESVYNNACNGVPRDRFTIAHEIGHLLLHRGIIQTFACSQFISDHSYEEDAEWQADMFASELLIDCNQLDNIKTIKDIADKFVVSFECAGYAHAKLTKEKFL